MVGIVSQRLQKGNTSLFANHQRLAHFEQNDSYDVDATLPRHFVDVQFNYIKINNAHRYTGRQTIWQNIRQKLRRDFRLLQKFSLREMKLYDDPLGLVSKREISTLIISG